MANAVIAQTDPTECGDSVLDCPTPPPLPPFEEICEDPAMAGMFPECRGVSPVQEAPQQEGARSAPNSSYPPAGLELDACTINPSLPGCPKRPQSLRCIVVPSPVPGAAEVCLDENNDVWDITDQTDSIVDLMTTKEFCEDLRIETATEFFAATVAGGAFVASCARLGAPGGGAGLIAAGIICGGVAGAAGFKIVNACKTKWNIEW